MSFENPVNALMPNRERPGIGKEIGETAKSYKLGRQALGEPKSAPEPVKAPAVSPVDKVNPTGAYGDRPGEKRIDVKDMVKPLGQMKKGGTVPKTGPYIMHKDEKVLTPNQHSSLKNAMGLAASALSHEEGPEPVQSMPAKVDKEMHVRRLDDKSFHIKHKHEPPHEGMEHDEEYSVPDIKGLKKHMEDHFGKEEQESPGVEAAEKAVGME